MDQITLQKQRVNQLKNKILKLKTLILHSAKQLKIPQLIFNFLGLN